MDRLYRQVQRRVDALPVDLRDHVYRVADISRDLAHRHQIDEELAVLAMLAHDVARAMSDEELMRLATELGLPVGLIERQYPILLHGPVGAEVLRREDGLADPSLYRAVCWHTTAHPDMDTLGKLVFLADKLDPQKIVYYPYLPQLQELANEDLDRAVVDFLTRETVARITRGEMVHPLYLEARNALLAAVAVPPAASR